MHIYSGTEIETELFVKPLFESHVENLAEISPYIGGNSSQN